MGLDNYCHHNHKVVMIETLHMSTHGGGPRPQKCLALADSHGFP